MSAKNLILLALCVILLSAGAVTAQDRPFEGVTVVVANNAGGNSDYMPIAVADWEAETGATVEVNPIPFGDIKDQILTAMSTGTFVADLFIVPSGLAGDLIVNDYVVPVPAESVENLNFDDLIPGYRGNLSWDGVEYAWPWDGDVFTLNYRGDLFEDAAHQEAFEAEYGYPLAPPTTWQEYADMAAYFASTDGDVPYGWAEVAGRGSGSFHAFSARAVGYAKHPDDPGFYFDPNTMDARINNPGFVRAMEDWIAALPSAIPSVTTLGAFETHMAFITGQVAFNVDWTDTGIMANDPTLSTIVGLGRSAMPPGSAEVWNPQTESWDTLDEPNRAGYAAFGGWIIFVPRNAANMEAALSLADYLGSPEVMTRASETPNSGVNPARISTLEDIDGWVNSAGFTDEAHAQNYLDSMLDAMTAENLVYQLRIPGYNQYEEALELAISEALTGQKSAQEALDDAAATWNEITDRLGREQQLAYYRADIGVEPLE